MQCIVKLFILVKIPVGKIKKSEFWTKFKIYAHAMCKFTRGVSIYAFTRKIWNLRAGRTLVIGLMRKYIYKPLLAYISKFADTFEKGEHVNND